MSAGMADIIAAHPGSRYGIYTTGGWWIGCEGCDWHEAIGPSPIETDSVRRYHAHAAEEVAKAGYGNVQEAKAEAITDAADWLANGEVAGIIAYDGPSNRGEVVAAYDAALADPESWLRERADAALTVDPAALHRVERTGLAEAWFEGRAAAPDALNPYEGWPSLLDPLAAALNDPDGHALVQAIHDRKGEG